MKQQLTEVKRLQELAGVVGEHEHNFLEDPNPVDDLPSVKLDIDDNGMMKIELTAFFHTPGNGKVPLLINNPALQEVVMKSIQLESQKAFRKAVHGVLGIPYGLPESLDLSDTPEFAQDGTQKIKKLPITTLDPIARTLSYIAKKRGCYDITKETDLTTISDRDFAAYKYGAFSCDLSDDLRRVLYDLGIKQDIDSDYYLNIYDYIETLTDRLEKEKLLYLEW